MSSKNKALFLFITLILLAAVISAGCVSQPVVDKKPQLIIATYADSNAYAFFDENGNLTGIDIDLAKLICNEIGAEPVIENIPFRGIIPAVAAGDIDMGIAGITITEERKKLVDFSTPYASAWQNVIYNPANGVSITSIKDLENKIIGVQIGTTCEELVKARYADKAKKVVYYEWMRDAINDLNSGEIDCVVYDNVIGPAFLAQNPSFKIFDNKLSNEEYSVIVKKGNIELLNKINAALEKFSADGTLEKIKKKYLEA